MSIFTREQRAEHAPAPSSAPPPDIEADRAAAIVARRAAAIARTERAFGVRLACIGEGSREVHDAHGRRATQRGEMFCNVHKHGTYGRKFFIRLQGSPDQLAPLFDEPEPERQEPEETFTLPTARQVINARFNAPTAAPTAEVINPRPTAILDY